MSRSAVLGTRQLLHHLTSSNFGDQRRQRHRISASSPVAPRASPSLSSATPGFCPWKTCAGCGAKVGRRIRMGQRGSRQVAGNAARVHVEGAQESVSQNLMSEMIEFLKVDLPNLFNEKGIDKSKYDEKVAFIDPITKYDNLSGYLLNIQMLRFLFSPIFELRNIKQTGPSEITTRWCMRLYFRLVPWVPEVVFTGRSIMTVNPATGRFNRHVDIWDSIQDNDYFSMEGLRDFLKQVSNLAQTPRGKQIPFDILKRTAHYEIRRYPSFRVLEASSSRSIEDTSSLVELRKRVESRSDQGAPLLPLLSWVRGAEATAAVPSIPVEAVFAPESISDASVGAVSVREVGASCVAAVRFSGTPSEALVAKLERELRQALRKDGLEAEEGYAVARYSFPGSLGFLTRNEVLVWLHDYQLD
ncbi:hypothetical protein KFL_003320040 [Klebsormidium nitens]|uniref:SOUL heme-binding protein n=1 Tax=Klebsormidium nitens TaxID=105231 RepID=A0A1Y1IDD1_KLENI|nr:hypothetical protein KFL_003320040 [Klebsormidium nitens]|eukprot:GAQ87111.1 hypothetical protein KFL_003320040 [Klebsormidium nitens]